MLTHETVTFLMILIFVIGYFFITIEHYTQINKATVALLMAISCWIVQFADSDVAHHQNLIFLGAHVASISQVVFFLLGALAVVETINVHKGFSIISNLIEVSSKRSLLWTVGFITFFLSAVLDNLTTTIVMISLLTKLVPKGEDRLLLGGAVVIAANAGGAWTPIGDVTTTMLWIGGQISTQKILYQLFLPSALCAVVSFFILSFMLEGFFTKQKVEQKQEEQFDTHRSLIFILGIGALLFVPFFKMLTGLPPFMGMLFALGVLWLVTDLLYRNQQGKEDRKVTYVLTRIDLPGILFFLGILLCVDALETSGILKDLAAYFDRTIGNLSVIAVIIGLVSAVVDNVPLVAASISMYDLSQIPQDHSFWQLMAYAAGTGGSILIVGSAAGVVYMGLEKVSFLWYLKRISLAAFVGYFAGIGIYLLQMSLF